ALNSNHAPLKGGLAMTAKTQLKKKKTMTKKFLMTSLALGALFLTTSSAHAQSAQIGESLMYPGANCRMADGSVSGFQEPTVFPNGALHTNGNITVGVVCPMYDNGTNFKGDVWVMNNNTSGQDIICYSEADNYLSGDKSSPPQIAHPLLGALQRLQFNEPTI